ncbi:MAG: VaFE repeat-containing surface-anchored protein [Eubacterium sp.]|nr:VaFE repeat-containing surface-anchored protein [Eubacterium sp.]
MILKKKVIKVMSGMLAAVTLFTSCLSPVPVYAAGEKTGEELDAYVASLPELTEVADHLYPYEAVSVKELTVTVGDKTDLAGDFSGISFDNKKVKLHFYRAVDDQGKTFSTEKPGTFMATYYAEALLSHNDYRFTRRVIVNEKGGADTVATPASEGTTEGKNGSGNESAKTSSSEKEDEEDGADTASLPEDEYVPEDYVDKSEENDDPADAKEDNQGTAELEESSLNASKADQLSYNILYVKKYGNKDYVNTDTLDYSSMVFPVTVIRGLATYNVKKQKEFEVTNNFIAGMTYSLPVYDVDEKSDYYVAMPDVNLFSRELASYDITVIYNNDYAEKIEGYHYEDKILYIPKNVIEDPQNENPLYEGGPLAVQLNYAFGGLDTDPEGNADFGKTLPVQVLNTKKAVPVNKSIKVDNVFEESVTIPDVVSGKDGYKKEDFSIFLNGMMVPVDDKVWDYEDGDIVIHSSPAIISNINVVYDGKGLVSKALSFLNRLTSAQVSAQANGTRTTTADMKVYKNKDKEVVTLGFDTDKMYVGWRGTFESRVLFAPHVGEDNYNTVKNLKNYDELENSTYYLYGGFTPNHSVSDSDWQWAIESYTIGKNKAEGVGDNLSRNKLIERNEGENSDQKLTIYQWFIKAKNNLEKSVNHFGAGTSWGQDNGSDWYVLESDGGHSNGIGGDTNFAFRVPKKVTGSSVNLVSDENNKGYGSGNPDITFSYDNLDVSNNDIYFAAGCTHFDSTAGGTDDNGNDMNRMYVSCLDLKDDYVVLAFTSAIKSKDNSSQEACAVYKFKITRPISIKKESGNAGISEGNSCYADLSGATYGLYASGEDAASDKDRVGTFTTKADGTTNEVSVSPGTYYVRELAAPKNYAINGEAVKITVTGSSESQIFKMSDPPQNNPLDIVLVKIDKETGKPEPQGAGALAGAQFTVKYFDNENGITNGSPKKTWVFKTDDKGEVHLTDAYKVSGDDLYKNTTGTGALPIGTYSIQETRAPAGYLIVDNSVDVQAVKASGNAETFSAFVTKNVADQVIRGGVQMKKEDAITGSTPQGDADLSGITFEITNASPHSVRVDGKDFAKGAVVKSIVTDAKGIAKTGNKDLPYGDYTIREVKTNSSYLLTDGKAKSFQIREDGKTVEINEAFKDQVVRGDVEVEKLDRETDARVPLGSATHVGTTFEITNKSLHPVYVDGKLYEPGKVCKSIRVEKEKETAKTTGKALPYGSYSIKEVAVGTGYLLTDTKERTFQIREDGKTVSISKDGDVKEPVLNQVKRGDFNFIKVFEDAESNANMNALSHIPFEVISKTTGEKHIIVTDENGQFDSDNGWTSHSKNTNANDAAVDADGKVDESKLTSEAGVWFDTDREGNKAKKVDDTLGALPYDTYVLNELSCKANEGAKLIKNKEFTIRVDKRDISLGTMDDPADRSIGTVAADGKTKDHFGSNDSETIIDTVSYKGLTKGQKYTMKGTLIDKETEEPVVISGKKVTAKESFLAAGSSGTIEMEFVFPKDALKGREVVAFETCETGGKVITAHEDIEDADQTVSYPDIETEAKDGQTESHFGLNDSTTIKDTVKYINLKPGKGYTMTGTLMDKATGKAVLSEGKEITAEKKFTPDKKDGEIELSFEVPAGLLTGKSVVAFERCEQDQMEIAVHTDIKDEDQTVHYPDIGTEAKDSVSHTHYGEGSSEKLVDIVSYVNLEPGKEYTLTGVLMDKETGKALLNGDKEITAEAVFTPEEKDGQVEMDFTFPAEIMKGKAVVAFETCYREKKQIAVHTDIKDEDQTVYYPEIGTEAADDETKTHYGVSSSTKLIDTVTYKNLEPGKEYRMVGTLMDRETGEAILSNGKEIRSEAAFTPEEKDGEMELTFEFPENLLAGKTVVAFESLHLEEREVAVHADISDEAQTVYYPGIGTEAKDEGSQSHYGLNASIKLIDRVTYQNLEPGREYIMKGTLMDKATGEAVLADGKEITAKAAFTPKKRDGELELVFEFPANTLAGKSVVVFETCCQEEKEVAVHADIQDEAQTVHYPKIGTTLNDSQTKDHVAAAGEMFTLIDTVAYQNFEPGRKYTMQGRLMDQATGKAFLENGKEVTSEISFTPEAKDGTVVLKFIVSRKNLESVSLVAFEKAITAAEDTAKEDQEKAGTSSEEAQKENQEPTLVASHEDLKDEAQTVHVPHIATNATDAGTKSHTGKASKTVTVQDKVTYKNLIPKKKYKLTGILMDKATGKAFTDSKGKTFSATKEFTPDKADGNVTLSFKVSGDLVSGKSLVAFEHLSLNSVDVAVHTDISDKDQTVAYKKAEATIQKKSGTSSSGGNSGTSGSSGKSSGKSVLSRYLPKTGDNNNIAFWIIVILASSLALGGCVTYLYRSKKRKPNH